MAIQSKYHFKQDQLLRDARPWSVRFIDSAKEPQTALMVFTICVVTLFVHPFTIMVGDVTFVFCLLYFIWIMTRKTRLPFKLPKSSGKTDYNDRQPNGKYAKAGGILYLGNDETTGEEIWFSDSDARTHCLYLGTTGAGKTVGLRSYACNTLCWSSGFIYIDGKADSSLWSIISAQVRRFGRDDDLLIMNYMTGNIAGRVPSNTLNPFSSGSASYLTNMLTSLMPDSGGDNAMWKERAVALVAGLLPCLVYKRDKQNLPLSIGVIRQYLTFKAIIQLSRDKTIPEDMRGSVKAYLDELPGYVDNVFDDNGDEKPAGPDAGMVDTSVPRQQHGYLSMQFTRSMQSLGDDYGFIFDTQAADIDMVDVVLNRRILVVLIPALEKSGDETANLGKIISSTLKGMMGATLGSTIEGESATVIENKPTNSPTPFVTIFDEVGYYTAQGMAVMAAQARSLGFSLVFAGQDLPAMEKRVKEEARSITANCNIKLFGKLEDPTQTKEFFEKTVGTAMVTEVSNFAREGGGSNYLDSQSANLQQRERARYDDLRGFTEGQAICAFGKNVNQVQVYYSDIGDAEVMRVHRFLPIAPPAENDLYNLQQADTVLTRLRNPKWNPAAEPTPESKDIKAMVRGFVNAKKTKEGFVICGLNAVAAVAEAHGNIKPSDAQTALSSDLDEEKKDVEFDKELAAAKELQEKTPDGPLSWTEVIGGDGIVDTAPTPTREDPPFLDAEPPDPTPAQTSDSSTSVAELSDAEVEAAHAIVQETNKPPLNWMDVIGDKPSTLTPAPAPKPPPPIEEKKEEDEEDNNKNTKEEIIPAAGEEKQSDSSGELQPMSWLDIIGGNDEGEDKK